MKYIACFGDSLVQGFLFGNKYSWVRHAGDAGRFGVLNYGLCGDCCDDIFERLRYTVLPDYVQHILFLGGANDIIQMRPQSVILDDVRKMAAWCAEQGYKLCLVLPLISGEMALNQHLEELKARMQDAFEQDKNIYLLDLQPAIGTDIGTLRKAYLDGVHPTAATYEVMGQYAAPLLAAWVEK